MNPPLTIEERGMFTEIMTQIRHSHDELHRSVARVEDSLKDHIRQEDGQYAKLQEDIGGLKEDVTALKTRWGIVASAAAILGAGAMATIHKVFF